MEESKSRSSLSSAMEDYLEAIYHLEQQNRIARVRDIADRLKVRMSSVTSALRTLSARGLLKYDPHQYITLTAQGTIQAQDIVRRHGILKRFLVRALKIDDESAEDNACRIEHHLDPEVIERLVDFLGFMEMCPVDQTRWVDGVAESCGDCETCLERARGKLRSRAKAQEAAVADGMTLAETLPGSQVLIEGLPKRSVFTGLPVTEPIDIGTIVEVEQRDGGSGALQINVKGYRLTLGEEEASHILVKPI